MANEKRLIDANALKDTFGNYGLGLDVRLRIDLQPTVDAVEMPCKIGDMVHRKDGTWDVVGFECDRTGSWRVKLERWKDQFRDYHETTKVSFKSFGKTVFLTKEAAVAFAKMDGEKKP